MQNLFLFSELHMGNIQDKTKQDCLDNLGGAGLKAVERAAQARKQLHSDLEKLIKEHINEVRRH